MLLRPSTPPKAIATHWHLCSRTSSAPSPAGPIAASAHNALYHAPVEVWSQTVPAMLLLRPPILGNRRPGAQAGRLLSKPTHAPELAYLVQSAAR
eukprot:6473448-Amphidinium_carterae.1